MTSSRLRLTLLAAASAALLVLPATANAATITIVNTDGANEGFNDPTPATPVGGNPGTTLGQQRLNVFEHAANVWGFVLDSNIEILVEASFDPLFCNSFQAALGQAATIQVFQNFPGAPLANTWYPVALANAISNTDLAPPSLPDSNDIFTQFNSSIDNNNSCLFGTNWYYGLDHNPGGDIDLLVVVLHELGHGLGFASFVNESTGAEFLGDPDVYGHFSLDLTSGLHWDEMTTDGERQASAINTGNLVWDGPVVTAEAPNEITSGFNGGFVRLYAPDPVQPGSSVSHWDTVATPDLLMEPAINPNIDSSLDLADDLMADIGWTVAECGDGLIEGGEVCDGANLGGMSCSDFGCTGGTLACNGTCDAFDTSGCTGCSTCNNNGVCDPGEDCNGCADCPSGNVSFECGNGVCEAGDGETCLSCPQDCNGKQNGKMSNRYCCGDGVAGQGAVDCSDPRCTGNGNTCTNAPVVPSTFCCGLFGCETGEDCSNCALDCTNPPEICTDGIDNDCANGIDCNDPFCSGDPACQGCTLGGNGDPCNGNGDCCSNKCKNGSCRGN